MFIRPDRGGFLPVLFLASMVGAGAQSVPKPAAIPLSTERIVEQMEQQDRARTRALKHYHSTRHYAVEYRGFPKGMAASLVVEVNYDAASGKSFRIVSQSGSRVLAEKVLLKAVESEKEAAQNKGATALTAANYRFTQVRSETLASGPAYVLEVEPKHPSKFLYRGLIWIDATDFALVKMETQPAKSPSFWISKTLIQSSSEKVSGFWLPRKLRSETKVRIGGGAVLTIDYGTYEVESENP